MSVDQQGIRTDEGKKISGLRPDFNKRPVTTKKIKTLKIAVSERLSEICQKNKALQFHFSLIAHLKIKPYEFSQKPE